MIGIANSNERLNIYFAVVKNVCQLQIIRKLYSESPALKFVIPTAIYPCFNLYLPLYDLGGAHSQY